MNSNPQCTAFEGGIRIASGALQEVALKAKEVIERAASASVLIFDDLTSELIEVDFRGTAEQVFERLTAGASTESTSRRPGRPRLGVVAREVTLLPRHWEWLSRQPGGASVALRKFVEHARRDLEGTDRLRLAREAAYRFMSAMAGNEPGFEEASRALFRGDRDAFKKQVKLWPADIRNHASRLAEAAFGAPSPA